MVGSKEVTIAAMVICSSSCTICQLQRRGHCLQQRGISCYGSLLDAQQLSMSTLAGQQLSRQLSMGMQTCRELSSLLSISVQACRELGSSKGVSAPKHMCMQICCKLIKDSYEPLSQQLVAGKADLGRAEYCMAAAV